MKHFLIFLSILIFSFRAYTQELSCSQGGTDIYYINGVLTSEDGARASARDIGTLISINNVDKIDEKNRVYIKHLHNPSYGLLNDAAELFEQAHYIKTGKKNVKNYYQFINSIPDDTLNIMMRLDPSFVFKVGRVLFSSHSMNLFSMKLLAGESWEESVKRIFASEAALQEANQKVLNGVKNIYKKTKEERKKAIIIAHSQGNSVLIAGTKELLLEDLKYDQFIRSYAGILHVASPVRAINYLESFGAGINTWSFPVRSILFDEDYIINKLFAKLPGFSIEREPASHLVVSDNSKDHSGHYFSETYLSDKVVVRKEWESTTLTAKRLFLNSLEELALRLESNCAPEGILSAWPMDDNYLHHFSLYYSGTNWFSFIKEGIVWDFGDGKTVIQNQWSDLVKHQYEKYGEYEVSVTAKFDWGDGKPSEVVTKIKVVIEPASQIELVEGTGVYKIMDLIQYPKEGEIEGRYRGRWHSVAGTLKAQGPVGDSYHFTSGHEELLILDCGTWTKTQDSLGRFNICERKAEDEAETFITGKLVLQCGGEGCGGHKLGPVYIPMPEDIYDNTPVYYFHDDGTGNLPAPIDF